MGRSASAARRGAWARGAVRRAPSGSPGTGERVRAHSTVQCTHCPIASQLIAPSYHPPRINNPAQSSIPTPIPPRDSASETASPLFVEVRRSRTLILSSARSRSRRAERSRRPGGAVDVSFGRIRPRPRPPGRPDPPRTRRVVNDRRARNRARPPRPRVERRGPTACRWCPRGSRMSAEERLRAPRPAAGPSARLRPTRSRPNRSRSRGRRWFRAAWTTSPPAQVRP